VLSVWLEHLKFGIHEHKKPLESGYRAIGLTFTWVAYYLPYTWSVTFLTGTNTICVVIGNFKRHGVRVCSGKQIWREKM